MLVRLQDGKIPTPDSPGAALRDREDCLAEAVFIQRELDDPGRIARFERAADYDKWRGKAAYAMGRLLEAARLLGEWVDEQEAWPTRGDETDLAVERDPDVEWLDARDVDSHTAPTDAERDAMGFWSTP